MDTASGCGKTVGGWVPASGCGKTAAHLVLPVKTGIHGGVTAVGTALTSSGFVAEGVPTRALPWIPHRGAVRRGRGGYRLGGRKDGCHLVLPVKTGIHGGVTAVGTAPTSSGFVAEGVPTRALPWIPHRGAVRRGRGGYRVGVRYDGYPIRLTGGRRYPWWCDGGGDRPYVERVCSRRGPHPGPTMDTASGCGKTREGWVPGRGAVRRLGVGTGSGCGKTAATSSYR